MKKQLFALLSLFSVAHISAYTVKALNNSDAPIKVRANGVGWNKEMTVAPGLTGELSSGAICLSSVRVSDAGTLSTPAVPVEVHYPTMEHCYNKELTISRTDNYQPFSSNSQTIVNTGSGSVSAAAPIIKNRQFLVQSKTMNVARSKREVKSQI